MLLLYALLLLLHCCHPLYRAAVASLSPSPFDFHTIPYRTVPTIPNHPQLTPTPSPYRIPTPTSKPARYGAAVQLNHTDKMDVDRSAGGSPYGSSSMISPTNSVHPQLPIAENSGAHFPERGLFGVENFEAPLIPPVDGSSFMDFGEGFNGSPLDFQEFLTWGEYPMGPLGLENYSSADLSSHSLEGFDLPTSDISEATSSSYARTSRSSRASVSTTHTRNTSQISHTPSTSMSPMAGKSNRVIESRMRSSIISEFEAVIAAENAWPLARCNPPIFSDTCPRTAIVHLETLEQNSQNANVWDSLIENHELALTNPTPVSVVPLNSTTRDRILAITQSFLHKALNTHRGGSNGWPRPAGHSSPGGGFSFLVLPPAEALEYFLQNYVRTLTSYFSLINGGTVDPNELMLNNQASTLLVLLMIAQGATAIPSPEARQLTAGLTETCRISLFDLIEKDVELSADPVVLRCALLFTMLAAWGGDKWHMDMAMGQRGMYLSMLKHAGMMEPQAPFVPIFDNCSSKDLQWRTWVRRETRNRLVYNWVMVDQELSLFHDTPCVLSTTELQTPIPSDEALWLARDADEWLTAFYASRDRPERRSSSSPTGAQLPTSPSIGDLFQDLLHDNIRSHGQLSPLQLKLLLHPLHSLVSHLRHILTCFSDGPGSHRGTRTVTKASTLTRLEEVQSLLQKWYGLCIFHANDDAASPIVQENLVLYHLISLNAVTSFPDIERVARREHLGEPLTNASALYRRCIYRREEALFHCGQVLRLINSMPKHCRPHWWPAAMYRATMVVWLYSLSQAAAGGSPHKLGNESFFAIDAVTPEHPSVTSYLWNGEGIPVLSRKDGSFTELDQPGKVLKHAGECLAEGIASRMSDGIKRKLQTLHSNWGFDPTEMVL
ncbi:hypothetical protein G7Y89_g13365 [Cudoniella acicularis]|uniref:Xylanolytic transcriptional activator regulatory domain-containing protein n=1 Tax=Cudoniella acicularis TaxID=354080 RepID=A0A8H4R9R8_9HELO|nr:hypothetical protein G7Y89_g13365 [Cudoniella acicularis]